MAGPASTNKQQIRQRARAARSRLFDRDERSRRIVDQLRRLPAYQSARVILFYVSVRDEVATRELIAQALAEQKQVVVPYCRDGELQLFHLKADDELTTGAYGILEPSAELHRQTERRIAVRELDLILVPGVAFDVHGARCGHGKGYYDKLLQTAKEKTPLIALAFDCQIFPKIPTESHDVFMDKIITESTIYPNKPSLTPDDRRA